MNFRLLLEWDKECGILLSKMYPLINGLEDALRQKSYGSSIASIGAIMICRSRDFKQRKHFSKDAKDFEYDILLDYQKIKKVRTDRKKAIICKQMVDITERTFSTYRFKDFDKASFLSDFKEIVNGVDWS